MTISEIGEVRESRINIAKGQLHLLWSPEKAKILSGNPRVPVGYMLQVEVGCGSGKVNYPHIT